MLTEKELQETVGHHVRVTYTDGITEEHFVTNYHRKEDPDEEGMLVFGPHRGELQSEIKSIEIIDGTRG